MLAETAPVCVRAFTQYSVAATAPKMFAICRLPALPRLLLLIALLAGGSCSARGQSVGNAPTLNGWETGFRGFRMLLRESGLRVNDDAEQVLNNPSRSAVIVQGQLGGFSRPDWLRLRRFVAQGGALLVVGEEECEIPGVTRFSGGPVTSERAAVQYSGFSDVLTLTPQPGNPLTAGVGSIVANRTGWLEFPGDNSLRWTVVAQIPGGSSPAASAGNPVLVLGQDGVTQAGTMILCADHSVLSDGMLWHGNNSILAINIAELLAAGSREQCAFLLGGRISGPAAPPRQRAPIQLPPQRIRRPGVPELRPPDEPPDLPTLIRRTNEFLDLLQESNLANEWLKDRPRAVGAVRWLRILFFLALLLVALFILKQIASRFRPRLPESRQRAMKSLASAVATEQAANSEFGPAAEILCREFCRELSGSRLESDWLMLRSEAAQTRAVAALPGRLQRGLYEVVSIAVRGSNTVMPRKRFEELGRSMRELRGRNRQTPLFRRDHLSPGIASATSAMWSRTRP